jgi:hypothetical protein
MLSSPMAASGRTPTRPSRCATPRAR